MGASTDLIHTCQRHVEDAWSRHFRTGLTNVRHRLSDLPVMIRCAVKSHDRREPRGALLFSLRILGTRGPEERFIVVAPAQSTVLLFSPAGGLDAAGTLSSERIDWSSDLTSQDWY